MWVSPSFLLPSPNLSSLCLLSKIYMYSTSTPLYLLYIYSSSHFRAVLLLPSVASIPFHPLLLVFSPPSPSFPYPFPPPPSYISEFLLDFGSIPISLSSIIWLLMDSCPAWSPPTELSPETCPLLDSILQQQMPPHRGRVSVSDGYLGHFCSSTSQDVEGISARFSSETLAPFDDCILDAAVLAVEASQFTQDSHLCDLPQSLHSEVHDAFLPNGAMSKRTLCPKESGNSSKIGVPKKIKVDESGSPSKAQISHSQLRKLSEKITALQQLVSPFGKSDTASVLSEAIGYIKFLQEQVHVLSSPYMTPIISKKGRESTPDLRSRGLCLVPISCTKNVATDSNGADFWISGVNGYSQ